MIQLLVGKKGSGKTKTLIENVNSSASAVSYTHLCRSDLSEHEFFLF